MPLGSFLSGGEGDEPEDAPLLAGGGSQPDGPLMLALEQSDIGEDVEGVDDGGLIEAVGDELSAKIPIQQRVSVVHGDYRLDNTVLDENGRVRAILDWEICTLGDPMADLGLLMVYWAEPTDPIRTGRPDDRLR